MGEIAEMMLDGCMCQWCGDFLGDGDGFPVVCISCQHENGVNAFGEPRKKKPRPAPKKDKTLVCSCGRRFREQASMAQHAQAKHCC